MAIKSHPVQCAREIGKKLMHNAGGLRIVILRGLMSGSNEVIHRTSRTLNISKVPQCVITNSSADCKSLKTSDRNMPRAMNNSRGSAGLIRYSISGSSWKFHSCNQTCVSMFFFRLSMFFPLANACKIGSNSLVRSRVIISPNVAR